MSAAAREMEAKVARIIVDAGGQLLAKGTDGAGHRTVTYDINGHQAQFHYPSSPQANGCGPLNCYTRLRREVRNLKARKPVVIVPDKPVEALSEQKQSIEAVPPRPTPPSAQKASQPTRTDIIKSYLSLRSLKAVCEKLGMERDTVIRTILSSRADAASFLRREIDAERAEAARALRPKRRNPHLDNPKERSQLAKLAHRLYFGKSRTAAETARILQVSAATAVRLAQEGDE